MKPYRIAVLPGDGIGPEIMQASLAVLRAVESPDLSFEFTELPFGAGHFRATGEMLPPRVVEECKRADAIFLAAIGLPEVRLPDGTEVQPQIIVGLRKELDLYAAIRPIKLYPGVKSVLADVGKGIDFVILRENTEGLFASFNGGGSIKNEVATDTMVITRKGTERIARYAFHLAARRNGRPLDGKKLVTCVDKANVFRSLAFFRRVFDDVAAQHPEIDHDHALVDAMTLYLCRTPRRSTCWSWRTCLAIFFRISPPAWSVALGSDRPPRSVMSMRCSSLHTAVPPSWRARTRQIPLQRSCRVP